MHEILTKISIIGGFINFVVKFMILSGSATLATGCVNNRIRSSLNSAPSRSNLTAVLTGKKLYPAAGDPSREKPSATNNAESPKIKTDGTINEQLVTVQTSNCAGSKAIW